MNRPGDWNCRSCNHLNFQRRDSCQRCREPKPGGINTDLFSGFGGRPISNSFGFNTGADVRPGDWYCNLGNCGTHNFASRSSCFKCGAAKDESSRSAAVAATGFIDMNDDPRRNLFGFGSSSGGGTGRSSWKSGDWICSRSGCNEHNFASRSECFRCNAPKEPTTNPPY
ncbi:unnamed protein product [Arabis nemorensis]|uniref:RanBP2-type domain-containing protein n=1 Tax=Arabis nemorensis TaxID=586526 RepID=A0A565CUK0_9BRAS|nr:unnamed protein product [Arabis nemorensis]